MVFWLNPLASIKSTIRLARDILYLHETELFNIELFWHLTVCKQHLYLYQTELAELELFE